MGEGYGCSNFHFTSTQPLQLQLNSYTVTCTGKPLHVIVFCTSDKEAFLYIRLTILGHKGERTTAHTVGLK